MDLRKLHEAATPAPWKQGTSLEETPLAVVTAGDGWIFDTSTVEDAALIVEIRNALPTLLFLIATAVEELDAHGLSDHMTQSECRAGYVLGELRHNV